MICCNLCITEGVSKGEPAIRYCLVVKDIKSTTTIKHKTTETTNRYTNYTAPDTAVVNIYSNASSIVTIDT